MEKSELKQKVLALPREPGVYIMKNARDEVIYVGKAKALKNRVSQYFQNQERHTEKTRQMVAHIDHFDIIVCKSEFEALVLENSMIKKYKPHYNILLKDDKGYPFIKVTTSRPFPEFSVVGKIGKDAVPVSLPSTFSGSQFAIHACFRSSTIVPARAAARHRKGAPVSECSYEAVLCAVRRQGLAGGVCGAGASGDYRAGGRYRAAACPAARRNGAGLRGAAV